MPDNRVDTLLMFVQEESVKVCHLKCHLIYGCMILKCKCICGTQLGLDEGTRCRSRTSVCVGGLSSYMCVWHMASCAGIID